ncbi:MAG TPA: phosphatidylglycerophosphatase A, partial [Terriglobia bacterium]|nr:phosphatidylglycerophosphatase A [Terriglobia bacterium]
EKSAFLPKNNRPKKFINPMEVLKTKNDWAPADWVAVGIATAGGAGLAPKAPGTAGSIVGVLIYLLIEALHAGAYYPHAIIFFFIVGIWASSRVEHLWGHDAQRIVIDEVVGQMITFVVAAGRYQLSAFYILLGFGLFRLFDIVKPFPIRRLERLQGGLGVVADDVGAGVYALAVLTLVRYIFIR